MSHITELVPHDQRDDLDAAIAELLRVAGVDASPQAEAIGSAIEHLLLSCRNVINIGQGDDERLHFGAYYRDGQLSYSVLFAGQTATVWRYYDRDGEPLPSWERQSFHRRFPRGGK